jgi:hypothetical protein
MPGRLDALDEWVHPWPLGAVQHHRVYVVRVVAEILQGDPGRGAKGHHVPPVDRQSVPEILRIRRDLLQVKGGQVDLLGDQPVVARRDRREELATGSWIVDRHAHRRRREGLDLRADQARLGPAGPADVQHDHLAAQPRGLRAEGHVVGCYPQVATQRQHGVLVGPVGARRDPHNEQPERPTLRVAMTGQDGERPAREIGEHDRGDQCGE